MKKIIALIPVLILIILNSSHVQAVLEDSIQEEIINEVLEQIEDGADPTYVTVESTVYYTPVLEEDFNNNWCSQAKGDCFTSTEQIKEFYDNDPNVVECVDIRNAGWCCINEQDRGAYEEVKCQGSIQANNRIYQYSTVDITLEDSTPIPSQFTRGRTYTETNPTKKWTVAVNPSQNSMGYIPYNTLMYIYWGEGNEWNGIYKAEDTGSAFDDKPKIDIYAGVGKSQLDQAKDAQISNKRPKIYVLDENNKVLDAKDLGVSKITSSEGTIEHSYSTKVENTYVYSFFNSVKKFIEDVKTCGNDCLSQKMLQYSNQNIRFNNSCYDSF
jgi:hypothetical protein